MLRCLALLSASLVVGFATAQNCANTSIGAVPLVDLGLGTYQGFAGGLYGQGQNAPPPAHLARGQQRADAITPRDAAGNPAPGGRIVLLSLGMSNTTQEFSAWIPTANADPNRNPAVTLVDGAQGGQDAVIVSDPTAAFWTVVDQRLAAAGVTPQQVQAVWLKQAIRLVSGGFPGGAQQLQARLAQIVRIAKQRYPNLEVCFVSSRTYGGYATTAANPEPYAYESGFAVQWLLGQQMAGDPALNCDPALGPVTAPWLGAGPYLWTDGVVPRSDGLTWTCADVQTDGLHPSPAGRDKVVGLLQAFFTSDAIAAPWYLVPAHAAAVAQFGAGCAGVSGVPTFHANGLPRLGNAGFQLGVSAAAPSAIALLWWSSAQALLPIAGVCNLLVDPAPALPVWIGLTTGAGLRIEPLPIPSQPALVGATLWCQWLVQDAAGAPLPGFQGIAATRGARLQLGL
ncbi:MAG: hypothetical protein ACK5AL_01325 [Planctomycetota bacterium]|jgi:hypothetical protein